MLKKDFFLEERICFLSLILTSWDDSNYPAVSNREKKECFKDKLIEKKKGSNYKIKARNKDVKKEKIQNLLFSHLVTPKTVLICPRFQVHRTCVLCKADAWSTRWAVARAGVVVITTRQSVVSAQKCPPSTVLTSRRSDSAFGEDVEHDIACC